jgi:hypothetical protein
MTLRLREVVVLDVEESEREMKEREKDKRKAVATARYFGNGFAKPQLSLLRTSMQLLKLNQ